MDQHYLSTRVLLEATRDSYEKYLIHLTDVLSVSNSQGENMKATRATLTDLNEAIAALDDEEVNDR